MYIILNGLTMIKMSMIKINQFIFYKINIVIKYYCRRRDNDSY